MILGINSFTHDVATTLIAGCKPISIIEEERITRRKHHDGFVFGGYPPYACVEKTLNYSQEVRIGHSKEIDHSARTANIHQTMFLEYARSLDAKLENTFFFNHHLCHAASAIYCSPFESAYICTLDSRGDGLSSTISLANKTGIKKILEIPANTSICAVYTYAAELLGLGRRSEGSLMAMAGYGSNNASVHTLFEWTGHSILIKGIDDLEKMCSKAGSFNEKADIANLIQINFVNAVLKMIDDVCDDKTIRNIALSGGGFLNCALNKAILSCDRWNSGYISPLAGDSGTSLGAAILCMDNPRDFRLDNIYLGDNWCNNQVEDILINCGITYKAVSDEYVAELLIDGKIGAIFDGAMEAGPRALGHRSIVASPMEVSAKDRINKIKKRQPWRPVAPSILDSYGDQWFVDYETTPFMTRAFDIQPDKIQYIPAVSHIDGTSRIHSVRPKDGFIYDLLNCFYKKTGIPILCNTSLNVQSPIVRIPEEAIGLFFSTPLDFLYCQGFLITKTK